MLTMMVCSKERSWSGSGPGACHSASDDFILAQALAPATPALSGKASKLENVVVEQDTYIETIVREIQRGRTKMVRSEVQILEPHASGVAIHKDPSAE